MTLIIGAICDESVVMIGDTKIVDPEKNTSLYEDKILMPLDFPVLVGAAGLTDLARQFNRKIPIKVDTRTKEFRLKNEHALQLVGKNIADYEMKQQKSTQSAPEQKEQKHTTDITEDELPYVYNMDEFLTDCKNLIKEISDEGRRYSLNPLEVLISLKAGDAPVLFHIDSNGFERQIQTYDSIGSGSVFVDLFFKRMWKKTTNKDTVALATFVIKFIQNLKLDNFVGIEEGELPQVMTNRENGWGYLDFQNDSEFLNDVNSKIKEIESIFENITFPELIESKGYEINDS